MWFFIKDMFNLGFHTMGNYEVLVLALFTVCIVFSLSRYYLDNTFLIIYHLTSKISPSGSSSSHSTFCIKSSGGCCPTISVLVTTFPPERWTTILWASPSTRVSLSHVVTTFGSPPFESECLSKLLFVPKSISLSVLQSSYTKKIKH